MGAILATLQLSGKQLFKKNEINEHEKIPFNFILRNFKKMSNNVVMSYSFVIIF